GLGIGAIAWPAWRSNSPIDALAFRIDHDPWAASTRRYESGLIAGSGGEPGGSAGAFGGSAGRRSASSAEISARRSPRPSRLTIPPTRTTTIILFAARSHRVRAPAGATPLRRSP